MKTLADNKFLFIQSLLFTETYLFLCASDLVNTNPRIKITEDKQMYYINIFAINHHNIQLLQQF